MKRLLILLIVLGGLSFGANSAKADLFGGLRLGLNNLSLRARNAQLRNELAFRDSLSFSRGLRFRGLGLSDEIRLQNRVRRNIERRAFLRRQALRRQALRRQLRREAFRRDALRLRLGADCF